MFSIKPALVTAAIGLCVTQTALAIPLDDISQNSNAEIDILEPSSALNATANDLTARDDCVWELDCPQFGASFDRRTNYVGGQTYHVLRVNHRSPVCNECREMDYPSGHGCKRFRMCGQLWEICLDIEKGRAHRWIGGDRHCFLLKRQELGACRCFTGTGTSFCYPHVQHPRETVDCTWQTTPRPTGIN